MIYTSMGARYAKKPPMAYKTMEMYRSGCDQDFVSAHAFPSMSQTTGGGNNLGNTSPNVKNTPPTMNTSVLCSPSQISCGMALVRLAKLAPAPRVTNSAGRAQQKRVPTELNNEAKATKCFMFRFTSQEECLELAQRESEHA